MSSRETRSYPYTPDPGDLPLLRGEAFAGWLLGRVVLTAGIWLVLGALACALLSLAGLWLPVVGGLVLLALLVLSVRLAALVPARPMPVWSAATLVVVALAATVWAGATHAEQVLPRRDSGSYLQSAVELAQGHTRPIDIAAASVGGPRVLGIDGVTLASPAFYEIGDDADPSIQPQFPVGPSAWYSAAWWAGGWGGAFWAPAVCFGLVVLGVGLLASLLVGPRWGPLAALGAAVCFPLLHVARSTYSEPLALVALVAAMVALSQSARSALATEVVAARGAALVAGGLLGGAVLLRVDALREAILVVPVAALAAAQRQPHARALGLATALSAGTALGLTWLTSSEYLGSIAGSLLPLLGLGVGTAVAGWVLVRLCRTGRSLPGVVGAWLPRGLAGAMGLAGLVLASRPLWQTVRQSAADPGSRVVAGLQQRQGLPVDGGRTYAEQTVAWMSWWVGPLALVLALVAASVLAHRAATAWVEHRDLPNWLGPALIGVGSTALTLYRPGITPDHPWADRRLVIALPTVVLLVVAVAAVVSRWSTRRLPFAVMAAGSVATSVALLVPAALATWPHASERVEAGELAAVDRVCAAFGPGDVALMADSRAANEWPQVLRGYCGVPALSTTARLRSDDAALASAMATIEEEVGKGGRRLVLVGADSRETLTRLGVADPRLAVDVTVREDARLLERRPDHLVSLPVQVWLGSRS